MNTTLNVILEQTFDNIEQIGSGGGGTIFKAHHKRLDIDVVLKKIHSNKLQSIERRAELDILKKLKHPYIPQVFDFIEYGNDVYTVMEYVEGYSFAQYLASAHKFRQRDVIVWGRQLAEVVNYLHSQTPPIIHCDIKPANIMLTPEGNICLIDFNISSTKQDGETSSIGYSDGYAPVEQFAIVSNRALQKKWRTEETYAQQQMYQIPNQARAQMMPYSDVTEIDGNITEVDGVGVAPFGYNNYVNQSVPIDTSGMSTTSSKIGRTMMRSMSDEDWNRARQMCGFLGEKPQLDERTDIYSIGATLYHILAGVKPAPFYHPYVPIEVVMPQISEGLAYIINTALQLKPEHRIKDSTLLLKMMTNIQNYDKRYKRIIRKQILNTLVCGGMVLVSILSVFTGRNMMDSSVFNDYHSLIEEMQDLREDKKYSDIEEAYEEAISIVPTNQEAYYQRAMAYYEQKEYEDCISFIERNVLDNKIIDKDDNYGRFHYIVGSCYLETEAYDDAIEALERAITMQPDQSAYHRDYIIALSRADKIEEAKEALKEAEELNIEGDTIDLLRGEIAVMSEDYEEALDALKKCTKSTEDPQVLLRAYIKIDDVLQLMLQDRAQYDARILELVRGIDALPDECDFSLMERLAQVYIDYSELSGFDTYTMKAIDLYDDMAEAGYETFNVFYNRAVLYEKVGQYTEAKNVLLDLGKTFQENYNVYKRLAFIELELQGSLIKEQRSYYEFAKYYEQTMELYNENTDDEDMDIVLLKQLYNDVEKNGWLR